MAVGFGELRLSPAAFWAMTPREFAAVFAARAPAGGEAIGRGGFDRLMARFPDGKGNKAVGQ
jgi:uncharacterized phage protein (TIGR02216 family)